MFDYNERQPTWSPKRLGMRYATGAAPGRSGENQRMMTATKLWLGFGTLIALMVLSSAAIIVRVRSMRGSGRASECRHVPQCGGEAVGNQHPRLLSGSAGALSER